MKLQISKFEVHLAFFDLPTYLVLLYNVPFGGAILDPPTHPNMGRH